MNFAIGLVETKGLIALVEATDAMAKADRPAIIVGAGGLAVQAVVRGSDEPPAALKPPQRDEVAHWIDALEDSADELRARLDDRSVELAAIDEDRGDEIQKHQRDDDRRKARIHGDVVVGEARQILAEHDARLGHYCCPTNKRH